MLLTPICICSSMGVGICTGVGSCMVNGNRTGVGICRCRELHMCLKVLEVFHR